MAHRHPIGLDALIETCKPGVALPREFYTREDIYYHRYPLNPGYLIGSNRGNRLRHCWGILRGMIAAPRICRSAS